MKHPVIGRSGHRVIGNATPCHRKRARANGASERIHGLVRTALQLAVAILREVFDESAYDRFLARSHNARSVASYRAFLEESELTTAQKPRCC
jgi:hypothetical protein